MMSVRKLSNTCIAYKLNQFRCVFKPTDDITDAPDEVKALAAAIWTPEVIAAWEVLQDGNWVNELPLVEAKELVRDKVESIFTTKVNAALTYRFDFATTYLIIEAKELKGGAAYSVSDYPFVTKLANVLNKTLAQTVRIVLDKHGVEKEAVSTLFANKIDILQQVKALTETDVNEFLRLSRAIVKIIW